MYSWSDNLQNLEHGYLIDDNLMDFVLLYKAEEKSAAPDFSVNTVYIFSACFYKKLTDFNQNMITVCHHPSLYWNAMDVSDF